MRHRNRFAGIGARALVLALPLAACGSYDEAAPAPESATQADLGADGDFATGAPEGAGQNDTSGDGAAAPGTDPSSVGGGEAAGQGGVENESSGAGDETGASEVAPVEASCEAVEPCGGDVVGTWVAAGSCLPVSGMADMMGFGLGCVAAPVTGALEVSGTWTANADGTFTDQTTTLGDSEIQLPQTCLEVSGTVTTCDRLGGALQSLGFALVTCADSASGSGCTCSATAEQAGGLAMLDFSAAESGTYTVGDNVVTTTANSNVEYAYCVAGDTMTMTPTSASKVGDVTGTIVLVRQ